MRRTYAIVGLSALLMLGGCSSRPISKTWGHVKKTYNTTKQVYNTTKAVARTTKSVAKAVNPLEYIYLSEHGEAVTPQGELFVTGEAMIGETSEQMD